MLASSLTGRAWAQAYSDAADAWLAAVAGDPPPGVALVAVGGYGRRQLCPGSDVDVLLLHDRKRDDDVRGLADRIWYPLWGTGVRVDHSVRTIRQAVSVADGDVRAALGLLDARCVWGDADLVAALRTEVVERWRRQARRRLGELADATEARWSTAGEVAFMLEPDLKEARGGLRDVAALLGAAAGTPVVMPGALVVEAGHVLLDVRVELHRRTGRGSDQLVLERQDEVAAALGYGDADALMVGLATAARSVSRAVDDAWRRVRAWIAGPRWHGTVERRPVAPGLALQDGEVVLSPDADPATDRSLTLRAAAVAVDTGAPLARETLARLAGEQPALQEPWSPSMRQALLTLLGSGPAAVHVFEELDEAGLLVRILPEWEAVRSRHQRNPLHRFTVDRHLCETAAAAAKLKRRVARPDLLLVGAWLHDIGKGRAGDHTELGMGIMRAVATRIGFEPADVETLVAMVELHLLLPDVASRRDLDDPEVVRRVAARVGSRERLELLAGLAEADGLATGPAAWGPWKAGLVRDLVDRVSRVLTGETPPPAAPALARAVAAVPLDVRPALDGDGLRVGVGTPRGDEPFTIAVAADDRPGLLADIADGLAYLRLSVLAATCASTAGGRVLDVFTVVHELGAPPDQQQLAAELTAAVSGRVAVGPRLAERAARAGRRRPSLPVPRQVTFEDGDGVTVLEVRAEDRPGLLRRVLQVLTTCGLDVAGARVETLGHEVVDAFFVTDAGRPVPPERRAALAAAVEVAVDEGR